MDLCPSGTNVPEFRDFRVENSLILRTFHSVHSSTRGYMCQSEQNRQKSVCPSEQELTLAQIHSCSVTWAILLCLASRLRAGAG